MTHTKEEMPTGLGRRRFLTGAVIFLSGQSVALLVPVVLVLNISAAAKTVLSILFFSVIPFCCTVSSIVVLGRPGFDYLKRTISRFFRRFRPTR